MTTAQGQRSKPGIRWDRRCEYGCACDRGRQERRRRTTAISHRAPTKPRTKMRRRSKGKKSEETETDTTISKPALSDTTDR